MIDKSLKIAIVGTGNVATAIGNWLFSSGFNISQILGRDKAKTDVLAHSLQAKPLMDAEDIDSDVKLILIAVKDDAIMDVSNSLLKTDAIVVHTSGTISMDVLSKHKNRGVFYPLQTFTINYKPDFKRIPFCIEESNEQVYNQLTELCNSLGAIHFRIDSEQRSIIHVSAVFANNFANHIWGISRELLESKSIVPSLLHPLMEETLRKALENNPYSVQTGPAVRLDEKTIQKHLSLLDGDEIKSDIYRLITKSIQNQNKG